MLRLIKTVSVFSLCVLLCQSCAPRHQPVPPVPIITAGGATDPAPGVEQVAAFKAFPISQQNNMIRVRSAITDRLNVAYAPGCGCCCQKCCFGPTSVWAAGFGDFYNQQNTTNIVGFYTASEGALLGFDYRPCGWPLLGVAAAYTHSDVTVKQNNGHGRINDVYGAIYAGYDFGCLFIDGAVLGGYNVYTQHRDIESPTFQTAISRLPGGQVAANLDLGLVLGSCRNRIVPFFMTDYVYTHEGRWVERNATSILNFSVAKSDYHFWRNELGAFFRHCHPNWRDSYIVDIKLSYVREDRWHGKSYQVTMAGLPPARVVGFEPRRNLFSPALRLGYLCNCGKSSLFIVYDAEVGSHFWDQNVRLELASRF